MVSARLLECASDLIKKRLFCYVKNSKQSITYAWLLALVRYTTIDIYYTHIHILYTHAYTIHRYIYSSNRI